MPRPYQDMSHCDLTSAYYFDWQAAYVEDLDGTQVFDSMFAEDPEASKLAALPGIEELITEYPFIWTSPSLPLSCQQVFITNTVFMGSVIKLHPTCRANSRHHQHGYWLRLFSKPQIISREHAQHSYHHCQFDRPPSPFLPCSPHLSNCPLFSLDFGHLQREVLCRLQGDFRVWFGWASKTRRGGELFLLLPRRSHDRQQNWRRETHPGFHRVQKEGNWRDN